MLNTFNHPTNLCVSGGINREANSPPLSLFLKHCAASDLKLCIFWGSWGLCAHKSRVQQQWPLTYSPSASPRRMCWESHATLGADWSQPQRILSYRARPSASVRFVQSSGGSSSYWAVALRFFALRLFLTPPVGVWWRGGGVAFRKPAGGSLSSEQQEHRSQKAEVVMD